MTDEQRTPDIKVIAHDVAPFVWRWPEGEERFEKVWDLEVAWSSRQYSLRHGLSRRRAYGRDRVRSVTWVGGQPMVEGVEADDYAESRALLSLLRIGGKKLVRDLSDLPAGYEGFTWVEHDRHIVAPHSRHCLALKIMEDDVQVWALHALLRMESKTARPATRPKLAPRKPVVAETTPAPHTQADLVRCLLELGRELAVHPVPFCVSPEANALIREDPFAFLLAVLFDQGIPAERAWAAPYLLKERLGHLDPRLLVSEGERLKEEVRREPALHRFVNTMAQWVLAAADQVNREYGGDAGAIWGDSPRAKDLQRRLEAFEGIGQKKAAMAVEILARDLGVTIRDLEGSDIAYDVHVRRVFLRTGLAERDDVKHMIEVARALHPSRPGGLDYPAWHVGRTWCHPEDPDCGQCALGVLCPKLVDRAAAVTGA